MDNKDNAIAKALNYTVLKDNFVDKDLDKYIYASLSAPPIKIVDKQGSNDMLDYIVECPNCGEHVLYGLEVYMLSGSIYCSRGNCRQKLIDNDPWLKKKYGEIFNDEN